ncbi:MAG: creatininase family protein [Candidatus Thermoplasmatota archaeon]
MKATGNHTKYENNTQKLILLEELTWKKIEQLDQDKTIFFIPLSPLEEHGPHLPIGTDLLTARDAAKEAIKTLSSKKQGYNFMLFPAIPLGYSKIASCFPGTVSVRVKTIRFIVEDTIGSLARFGFKFFVICTFHMDLGHLKGIYTGIKKITKTYPVKVIEPWGPYFFHKEVEKREPSVGFDTKKEVHACFRETSLMKYQYPYLVDESYKNLQNIYRDLYSPRFIGKTFKEIGITEGYIGSPARADSDYGRWYFQQIVDTYVNGVLDLLNGKEEKQLPKQIQILMRSMFWV